jgi:hypothetical protein
MVSIRVSLLVSGALVADVLGYVIVYILIVGLILAFAGVFYKK